MKKVFRLPVFFTLICSLFWLTGCQTPKKEIVVSTQFLQGNAYLSDEFEEAQVLIITSLDEITPQVEEILSDRPDALLQLQSLDFNAYFVILFMKEANKGDRYFIRRVFRLGEQLIFRVQLMKQLPNTQTDTTLTYPYAVVAVAREGAWNDTITFTFTDLRGKVIIETQHFIP